MITSYIYNSYKGWNTCTSFEESHGFIPISERFLKMMTEHSSTICLKFKNVPVINSHRFCKTLVYKKIRIEESFSIQSWESFSIHILRNILRKWWPIYINKHITHTHPNWKTSKYKIATMIICLINSPRKTQEICSTRLIFHSDPF